MSGGVLEVLARWAPACEGVEDVAERERVLSEVFEVPADPQRFGRYVVLGVLGEGGMGTVLEAFDRTLERRVAVKVLHEELDEEHADRLLREAQALARLSHPNVVQVYETDVVGGRAYIAMELVDGETIKDWMTRDPRPGWRPCVETFIQVGQGLAAAHAEGLVHRDFKPGNAMIDRRNRARVLDFGLARRSRATATGVPITPATESSSVGGERRVPPGSAGVSDTRGETARDAVLTRAGHIPGTLAYMSPEQMKGRELDDRSDQFSYCVALWEALHGERPFRGDSRAALAVAVSSGEVRPPPKDRAVPESLRVILRRGLATDPEQRWPSMDDLMDELRALVAPPAPRRSAGWAMAGLLGVGAAVAVPQVLEIQQRCTGAREQLGDVWSVARRRRVEDAMLGTQVSHAPSTWERVESRIDEYAQAWVDTHNEVCEATSVRHEQTSAVMALRMRCLRARRVALDAVVGVLVEADSTVVEKAVEAVVGLPDIGRCDDVEWLERHDERVPLPEEPGIVAEVESLRDELADVRALHEAGRYGVALERAERAVQAAAALGYPPLWAEAELRLAQLLKDNGRYREAERGLVSAHARALAHGHAEVVLEAAQVLTFVVGVARLRKAEALVWAETAVHLAEHHAEHKERARSLGNLSAVFQIHGDQEQAEVYLRRALRIFETALGPEHINVGMSLGNLGTMFYTQGKHGDAESHLRRALRIFERALGPMHPRVAMVLDNLGLVSAAQGHHEAAMSHHRRALRVFERRYGARHPALSYSLVGLAKGALEMDELRLAREYAERAVAVREQGEAAPALVAEARFVLARALWEDEERRGDARELAEAARDVFARGGAGREGEVREVEEWLAARPL